MTTRNYCTFDKQVDIWDVQCMHPGLQMMFAFTNWFCLMNGIDAHWTSMHRPVDAISKSTTHQEYRAIDLSLHPKYGWTEKKRAVYEAEVNGRFKGIGAMVLRGADYVSVPIYIHPNQTVQNGEVVDGEGEHAHLQVRKDVDKVDYFVIF